jgi:hypothetical protein
LFRRVADAVRPPGRSRNTDGTGESTTDNPWK